MYDIKLPKIFQPFRSSNLIRLGKNYDGGYIVDKNDVERSKVLVSFGIGDDCSFEQDFSDINNCYIAAFDKNVNPDIKSSFFNTDHRVLVQKYISLHDTFDEMSINVALDNDNDVFLKCDIEGGEYAILDYLIQNSKRFTGMVLEFHSVNKPENLNDITNFISKIDQKLLHIHINNWGYYQTNNGNVPDVIELSFTSSDVEYDKTIRLPNDLDMPNNPNDAEFRIEF